ncbi:hypothetical protein, partial [Edaphobacter sp.]|uniref:hypothetical protein n=1 Tax=Edaphobacter sp. TaxID=1934404 RepID=UPI002D7F19BE
DGLGAQLVVGERLDGGLKVIDLLNGWQKALYGAFVAGAEDFCKSFIEQTGVLRGAFFPQGLV